MLVLLAGYLPNLDELLQNGNVFTTNNLLLAADTPPPQPEIFLTQLDPVAEPGTGSSGENTPPGTVTGQGTSSVATDSIPEPSLLALLGLGFAGLMLRGRRWCQ